MPYKPKGRAEMLKRFNAIRAKTRKPGFDGHAIILGTKGGITRKKLVEVIDKLKLKRELHLGEKVPVLHSPDNVMFISGGAKVTAIELATRFSLKYLMRPLKRMNLTNQQQKGFEALLLKRKQLIKGTNIDLRPALQFLIIELANSFGKGGHKKAFLVAQKLTKRGQTLKKMIHKTKKEGDVFFNIASIAAIAEQTLEFTAEELVQQIPALISERKMELEELKQTNIPRKELYVKLIEEQIEKARLNYIKYIQNNL